MTGVLTKMNLSNKGHETMMPLSHFKDYGLSSKPIEDQSENINNVVVAKKLIHCRVSTLAEIHFHHKGLSP